MRDSSSRDLRTDCGSGGAAAPREILLIPFAIHPVLLFFIVWLVAAASAFCDQGWEGHSLHVTWENDAIRGSDRHYTQGARIRYLSSDEATPRWLGRLSDFLPAVGFKSGALKFGLEAGQEIYTPDDLDAVEPIREDRPYAGWLCGSLLLQRRGTGGASIPVMESFGIDLGVIGPESFAEDTQKVWHGRDPRGWNHQLRTEAGVNLRYDRSCLFRFNRQSSWNVDVMPGVDASLGNVDSHLASSAVLRAGYNVPDHFEVPIGKTDQKFGVYLFLRTTGRLVLRNIFLDGNTWRSSHSVDKNYWVGDLSAGITLVLKSFELTASNHYRTREFHGQDRADSFGSATIGFKF